MKPLRLGIAFALAAAAAFAAPDFTGEWKMVPDKSTFGPFPAPDKIVYKVKHTDPDMTVETTQAGQQGEFTFELKYSTDGKETTNKIRDNEAKCVAKWEGEVLRVVTKAQFGGNDITIDDKWTLAEDKKSFTLNRKLTSPMGELDQTILFEKQ
jgi:hypothetical protein